MKERKKERQKERKKERKKEQIARNVFHKIASNIFLSFCSNPMDMVYFEEALDFLIDHPQIESEKGIGVCGISKGAEFGLAMAASIPSSKIGAVAAINGTVYSCMVPIYYKNKLVCEGNRATFLGLEGKKKVF